MRMASMVDPDTSLFDYTETDVHIIFKSLGFPQYEAQIYENTITGDVLATLNHEELKDLGVTSVGQRLTILKAVYALKQSQGIAIEAEDYIPPSEDPQAQKATLASIFETMLAQDHRIQALEEENQRLQDTIQMCLEEVRRDKDSGSASLSKAPSFKWKDYKQDRSPTRQEHLSPSSSPLATAHNIPSHVPIKSKDLTLQTSNDSRFRPQVKDITPAVMTPAVMTPAATTPAATTPGIPISQATPKTSSSSRSNGGVADATATDIRSFKVSLDDPAWKVLPAALKKYKINNDDWQNYAMFICYGTTERCLSYDEKPLLLFQKLKDAKKNPVFMLKHIRDIRSPIFVAQQKQAARTKEKEKLTGTAAALSKTSAGATTKTSRFPDVMSPTVSSVNDGNMKERESVGPAEGGTGSMGGGASANGDAAHGGTAQPLTNVSYAIAIYPYTAEQEDEFDVAVNDTFIILSRARGWWVVQRDPSGSGHLDPDQSKQGWVPAGCLLETSMPVAQAIADAIFGRPGAETVSETPIMPSSIVSTSYPGVALMDYRKKGGDEELDVVKDDALRVFKRYNHWSYAVKETNGERGWLPSWFIGKVGGSSSSSSSGMPPQTPGTAPVTTNMPSTAAAAALESTELRYALDGPGASPVSPGFGALQPPLPSIAVRAAPTMI